MALTTDALCSGEQGSVTVLIDSSETGFYEINNINAFYSGTYSSNIIVDSLLAGKNRVERIN